MLAALAAGAAMLATPALADGVSDDVVKIGVLTDMSGVFSDMNGNGSVVAAQLAIEDFGSIVLDKPIQLISADHQHKADVGTSIAHRWIDNEQVDVLADLTNSAIALAVQDIARDANRIALFTSPGTTDLTGAKCSETGFHWVYDNYSNGIGPIKAQIDQGMKKWYFLVSDFAFGHSLEAIGKKTVEENGAELVGTVRFPLNAPDMSAFLLPAQASGAEAILLTATGRDLTTAIKQANEFGLIAGGQSIVAPVMFLSDIHAMGLEQAKGISFIDGFYWDRNDETRAFSTRFGERHNGAMPTSLQAGVYSAVTHYLKAVQAAGTDEAKAVAAKMRELPVDDFFARGGKVREDGRMVHDMYLVKVKSPEESNGPWDYEEIIATIPGDDIFLPLAESTCPLVKK
ncbi:ABC transporter substrate-binding protein [Shinella daejeonensis]|uniref:ABC transporter substrate-binding protein n=1 Tax=Shinella daejeonensis TaxID=659017 RepID=UPI0020C79B93|nr:ABC transporter substrate-binding protein [Shinella daejeonensis]MCP8896514.1 ABC transporter substrate-binding protein [Shinella daejeonensis]